MHAGARQVRERAHTMSHSAAPQVSTEFLQRFTDAWNRHDIEGLMACVTDDCIFEAVGGPDACGARHPADSRSTDSRNRQTTWHTARSAAPAPAGRRAVRSGS